MAPILTHVAYGQAETAFPDVHAAGPRAFGQLL
jgi:hypothetical protein